MQAGMHVQLLAATAQMRNTFAKRTHANLRCGIQLVKLAIISLVFWTPEKKT
jgi:hypothetical protein